MLKNKMTKFRPAPMVFFIGIIKLETYYTLHWNGRCLKLKIIYNLERNFEFSIDVWVCSNRINFKD